MATTQNACLIHCRYQGGRGWSDDWLSDERLLDSFVCPTQPKYWQYSQAKSAIIPRCRLALLLHCIPMQESRCRCRGGHWSMLYNTSILVFRVREHPQKQHYYKVQSVWGTYILCTCVSQVKVHLWCLLYAGVHFYELSFACIVTHLANQNVLSPCRLLGHSRPGEIQQYASLVLPPGSCMHPGTHIHTPLVVLEECIRTGN